MDPDHKLIVKRSLQHCLRELVELSHRIHSHPELAFEEEHACRWSAALLAQHGFTVDRGTCDLPTAFAAEYGPGPLTVVLCAEYDALPDIGHACGHNIITASAVGAALALAPVAGDLGVRIRVLGTPGEEAGNAGGKILLLERGAFDGAHAALMVHPAPLDSVEVNYCAAAAYRVEYRGRASHPSAAPQLAISAADALTLAHVALGLLRDHIRPEERIHAVTRHADAAANLVPELGWVNCIVRARNVAELRALAVRVVACFEAAATATGCAVSITGGDRPYADMRQDRELLEMYRANAETLGRRFADRTVTSGSASTDMGNVSYEIPSIHPCIGIESYPVVNHQPAFAECCRSVSADRAVRDGALALAWTIVDLASHDPLRARLLESGGRQTANVITI